MTRHHRHHDRRHHHYESGGQHDSRDSHQSTGGHSSARSGESKYEYGVWKGTPVSYTGQTLEQDRSPHITLKFTDGTGSQTYEAQINVASTSTDTQLVYWLNKAWTHPVTSTLTALSEGFHQATTNDGTGLSFDYLRTKPALVDFAAGQVVQDSDSSQSNDILGDLEPIIKAAIAANATLFIAGRSYGTGIDDIHMDQGNTGDYENAVGEDGALIFYFPNDKHFEAVFLAFATQEIPTNDQTGAPTANAKALDTIAGNGTTSTS